MKKRILEEKLAELIVYAKFVAEITIIIGFFIFLAFLLFKIFS